MSLRTPVTHLRFTLTQEVHIDTKGLTLRMNIAGMSGIAKDAKRKRTVVCLGHTPKGWLFVPTTSSWTAPWQTPITQTGNGWSGWDLRYRKPLTWCPNMALYLTDEQVKDAIDADDRVGHAPMSVVRHGLKEIRYAIDAGLMDIHRWFNQPGLVSH